MAGRLWRGVRAVLHGVTRARTLGLAAEMSFWVFLSLVPLAAVAGFVAARLATSHDWMTSSVVSVLPAEVRTLVEQQLQRVASWHGGAVAPIALATFVWLASGGVSSVFDALEMQSGATPRAWWKKRLLAIVTCIALSLGVALLALLGAGLDWVRGIAGNVLPASLVAVEHGAIAQLLRWGIAAVVAIAMVAGLYRVGVPRDEHTHPRVLPGAVVAVVLQAALALGYGLYVSKLGGGGDAYQAGLAVVGVTLITLWLLSIALLLGAQLNCVLAGTLPERQSWPASAVSSSPPTSPRPPTGRSITRSTSPPVSARR